MWLEWQGENCAFDLASVVIFVYFESGAKSYG